MNRFMALAFMYCRYIPSLVREDSYCSKVPRGNRIMKIYTRPRMHFFRRDSGPKITDKFNNSRRIILNEKCISKKRIVLF